MQISKTSKRCFGASLMILSLMAQPLWAQDWPFRATYPLQPRDGGRTSAQQIISYGPLPENNAPGQLPPEIHSTDLIGWSSDGTNDEDDWAATAMVWAIMAKAGLQSQFVHFDYNNRFNDNTVKTRANSVENRRSTLDGALQFRFNHTRVYNGIDLVQRKAAVEHVRSIVESCGPDKKFYYIQAGSFEVAYQALKRVSEEKRQYCVLVSHVGINEWDNKWPLPQVEYQDDLSYDKTLKGHHAHGMVDCVNPYEGSPHYDPSRPKGLGAGYYFTGLMGRRNNRPQFGGKGYTEGMDRVSWMETSPISQYQWVHERFALVANKKKGGLDASDGGMGYALVSGQYDYGIDGGIVALNNFLNYSLTLPAPLTPIVTRLEIINTDTSQVVREISDGDVIDPDTLPSNITLRAVTEPVHIGSVEFKEDSNVIIKDEVGSHYTINEIVSEEDHNHGFIQPWNYEKRAYNLTITPRLDSKGTPRVFNFSFGTSP